MFRPFSGWAIIRLRLEYLRKHYNVDYTSRMGERDLVLQWLGRCVAIYVRDVESALVSTLFVVFSVGSSKCGPESSSEVALSAELGNVGLSVPVGRSALHPSHFPLTQFRKTALVDTAVCITRSRVTYQILFDSAHKASKCTLLHPSLHITHGDYNSAALRS
jgi:hypothetical protein